VKLTGYILDLKAVFVACLVGLATVRSTDVVMLQRGAAGKTEISANCIRLSQVSAAASGSAHAASERALASQTPEMPSDHGSHGRATASCLRPTYSQQSSTFS